MDALVPREAGCRERPELPIALVTGPAQRRVLHDCNDAARAAGLYPGQGLLAAQALLPVFAAVERAPAREAALRRFLAAWAYRYSSLVALEGEDDVQGCTSGAGGRMPGAPAVLLEVEASLGLFGPWPRFEARLREDLAALGITHRIALAPTPLGACLLAAASDGLALADLQHLRHALGRVPLELARLPGADRGSNQAGVHRADAITRSDTLEALESMGIRKLRQLFALPRDALARRFGAPLLAYLDRLTGAAPDPREWYRPPDVFDQRVELAYEVTHHPALLFALRRLVNDLAAYLAGRDGGVQRFVVALEHEPVRRDAPGDRDYAGSTADARSGAEGAVSGGSTPDATEVVVGLLGAERDPARLFELARAHLERTAIPAPVHGVRLIARELPPFVPAGRDLFDPRPAQALPWDALRERLRARLGEASVYQLRGHADPRPEHSLRRCLQLAREPEPLDLPPRPTWLLPQPLPLRDPAPEVLAGPERIESGWWDGGDVRRDYYVLRTAQGQLAWAYRAAGEVAGGWMLQGWFA
jgi:protein ImuB